MPEISVVVPTFNRCGLLIKCLKSLFEQDLDPASYEVIVVVDGSTDRTMDELAAVRARCRFEYRLQPNSGAAAARNRGLALAAGNIVLFVDDDMIADRGLLLAHLAEHGGYHDAAVVGSVEMIAGHSTRLAMQVFDSLIDRQSSAIKDPSHLNPHDLLTGNFSIFRERLLGIGGFDADLPFGEDFELGLRLLKAGVRIRYCGRARSQEIYTRGNELVTREPYWRGLAHGRIARKHPRATVLLKLDRFYMGSMPLRLMRLLAWYAPPALARLARSPGALYWAGVAAGIGSMSMFSTLARQRLIVLCYHMVDDNLSQSIATYSVTVQQFHRQMEFLHQQGYSAVTLREWFASIRGEFDLPPKPVVITFDDAYRDLKETAWPILQQYGFRPVVFAVAAGLGKTNFWDERIGLPSRDLLNVEELRTLQSMGAEIGSHGVSHRTLPGLSEDEQIMEIQESGKILEAALGTRVTSFSYPYGNFTRQLMALASEAGYDLACCTFPGWNTRSTNPYAVRRSCIDSRMSDFDFGLQLTFPAMVRLRFEIRHFLLRIGPALRRRLAPCVASLYRGLGIRRFGMHYFENKFRVSDPWRFAERDYECQKYQRTLSMLEGVARGRILEAGCAEGMFTEMVGALGHEVLGIDISDIALKRARIRCKAQSNVSFLQMDIFRDRVPGQFNLVICGEVLCFAEGRRSLEYVCRSVATAVESDGCVLLVHLRIAREHSGGWPAWDLDFGADSIHATFQRVSGFQLVKEHWNDHYGISLFQNG